MTDTSKGILALIAACTIWGLSPLFYKALSDIAPLEVLAHRTLWSLAFFALGLMLLKGAVLYGLAHVFNLGRRNRWLFTLGLAQAGFQAGTIQFE